MHCYAFVIKSLEEPERKGSTRLRASSTLSCCAKSDSERRCQSSDVDECVYMWSPVITRLWPCLLCSTKLMAGDKMVRSRGEVGFATAHAVKCTSVVSEVIGRPTGLH